MSFQICFVKEAVYPVIERGGRQVRPRLILKVNCKRVNMFKYILAKISKFLLRRLKSAHKMAAEIVPPNQGKSIRTSHGPVVVINDSTKSVSVTFYE